MQTIVVAALKEWNISNYFKLKKKYENRYCFELITRKEQLRIEALKNLKPRYIFFPHWSWIIPEEIFSSFECILFHMTDLPYGRGGSPLQNLILNEVYETKITALRVNGELDSGDIYLKESLDISLGSAEEIYMKASHIIFDRMIPKIIENQMIPIKQRGEIVEFQRRKPQESDLTELPTKSLRKVYDFIRMLDAKGYPKAYLKLGDLKIEFSEVHLKSDKLTGRFEVKKDEQKDIDRSGSSG